MSYYSNPADNEGFYGRAAALPDWCLLFGGGIVSMGIGAVLVFLPPVFGVESSACPEPTDTLALASLLVVLVRIGEIVYDSTGRGRARTGSERRTRERDTTNVGRPTDDANYSDERTIATGQRGEGR